MSSEVFNKENLDTYLKELGKEYRRLFGKNVPAEIILIGGASVLVKYTFRQMSSDVDAIIRSAAAINDAINIVGNKHDLPYRWLNDDFMQTESYTPKLLRYCQPYRTFSNVLNVRTVSAEYLVAMKLCSGRKYKHDLSDIVGILGEHEKLGSPITMEDINVAVQNLYGGWDVLPKDSVTFIQDVFRNGDYEALYERVCKEEEVARDLLVEFESKYPGVTNGANVNDILAELKARQEKESLASVLENAHARFAKEETNGDSEQVQKQQKSSEPPSYNR